MSMWAFYNCASVLERLTPLATAYICATKGPSYPSHSLAEIRVEHDSSVVFHISRRGVGRAMHACFLVPSSSTR